jgi:hypothetical protein
VKCDAGSFFYDAMESSILVDANGSGDLPQPGLTPMRCVEVESKSRPLGEGGYRFQRAVVTGAFTGVSQLWWSGLLPLVMAKNSSWRRRVMGPATPLPTWM